MKVVCKRRWLNLQMVHQSSTGQLNDASECCCHTEKGSQSPVWVSWTACSCWRCAQGNGSYGAKQAGWDFCEVKIAHVQMAHCVAATDISKGPVMSWKLIQGEPWPMPIVCTGFGPSKPLGGNGNIPRPSGTSGKTTKRNEIAQLKWTLRFCPTLPAVFS